MVTIRNDLKIFREVLSGIFAVYAIFIIHNSTMMVTILIALKMLCQFLFHEPIKFTVSIFLQNMIYYCLDIPSTHYLLVIIIHM